MEARPHLYMQGAWVQLFLSMHCDGSDTVMLLFPKKILKQLVRTDMGLCQLW